MNEHTLREQLQNEIRRCAEAVARAREAEADRDRLADALEAERHQVAVESGESDRLEALLEAESRLRAGLVVTADSLARKLSEVEDENELLRAVVTDYRGLTEEALDTVRYLAEYLRDANLQTEAAKASELHQMLFASMNFDNLGDFPPRETPV